MQLCRIATQFSLRTPECTDIITRAYSLRWIEKGFSTYDVTSDQAAAEDSIPTSLLSPSQAEYDGLPTIPASEFGQSFSSDHSMSSQRVQSLRHPRSIEFYHRRHREVKKFEKKQSRIHNLREIAREKAASGHSRLAQAAATEADRLESPWLSSNTPVKPPSYACVSQGQATALKHVVYASIRAPTEPNLDLKKETKKLDVLNLKVGYAVDAQYALPDEVKAFVLDQTTFCLYGIDKNQVTQIAANIRRIRPPEPYKGAGIRIVGESIKLKERKVK